MSKGPKRMFEIERFSVSGLAPAGAAAASPRARAPAARAPVRGRVQATRAPPSRARRRGPARRPGGRQADPRSRREPLSSDAWTCGAAARAAPGDHARLRVARGSRAHGIAMPPSPLPIVAIVGRPNVGKSTLFNRYAGARRALVEDEPGVTRDSIAEEVLLPGGRRALVVDTAGLDPDAEAGLPAAVQAQARAALAQADAILFVVDAKSGLVATDETLARALRRTAKPVALVVNKIDHPSHAPRLADFARLGFAACHAVSAEHGGGAWDALEELVQRLPAPSEGDAAPEAAPPGTRVALVGRPNVGKSSLVNRLVGEERVVVSEVPGTTRDSIDTRLELEGRAFTLIDTAGLRRPGRRTRTAERGSALMTVRSLERADAAVVVLDASEGPTEQDARVAALALERGRPLVLAANKWDLVAARGAAREREVEAAIRRALHFLPDAPLLRVS